MRWFDKFDAERVREKLILPLNLRNFLFWSWILKLRDSIDRVIPHCLQKFEFFKTVIVSWLFYDFKLF